MSLICVVFYYYYLSNLKPAPCIFLLRIFLASPFFTFFKYYWLSFIKSYGACIYDIYSAFIKSIEYCYYCGVTNVMAVPLLPARPVLPIL